MSEELTPKQKALVKQIAAVVDPRRHKQRLRDDPKYRKMWKEALAFFVNNLHEKPN